MFAVNSDNIYRKGAGRRGTAKEMQNVDSLLLPALPALQLIFGGGASLRALCELGAFA